MDTMSMPPHEAARDPKDLADAQFFSWGSKKLKEKPFRPLDRLLVGPNVVPDGWQVLEDVRPSQVAAMPWTKFEGDRWAIPAPIPRLYRKVGVVSVRAVQMMELRGRSHDGVRDAVALRFGIVAVMGAFKEGLTFNFDPQDPNRILAGARVSRGDAEFCAGVYDTRTDTFTPAADQRAYAAHEELEGGLYKPLRLSEAPAGLI
jgi:hypothetical protein